MLHRSGLVVLSSVVTYLSFPNIFLNEGFPVLAWGALVPFLAAIDERPVSERFALGCLWSGATFVLLTRWMFGVSIGGGLMFTIALALGPIVFTVLDLSSVRAGWFKLVWWPSLWALSEFIRTLIMGGFAWSLAYSQASFPELIRAASWGGMYAVVWIVVCVNAAVYLALKTKGSRHWFWAVAILVFVGNWCWGTAPADADRKDAPTIRLALIQPNLSRSEKTDPKKYDENAVRHLLLTRKAVSLASPDLVVWPETAFPDDVLNDGTWRPRMEAVARSFKTYMLIGSALEHKGYDINAALLLSPRGEWKAGYQKTKLVPFSEYTPHDPVSQRMARVMGMKGYNFLSGKGQGVLSLEGGLKGDAFSADRLFGVLICSEEGYPSLVRELVRRQVSFIVVMLNDGWFRQKEMLMMHAQNAAFRAVESGITVARASNTGRTVVLDPNGRQVRGQYPPLNNAGFAIVDVPLVRQRTAYAIFGDIFVWGCTAFVIITMIFVFIKRRFFPERS